MSAQLKITMPPDLREEIESACAKSGLSLGAEIRRRLWSSLAQGVLPEEQAIEIIRTERAWLAEGAR